MAFLSTSYALESLAWHLALFFAVYGAAYAVLFEWRPARLAARKCAPGKYPSRASVLREMRRSTVSVVIAWAMDLAVMHGLDLGLRGKLELAPEGADGRSNGWLPSLGELQARGWSLLPLVLMLVLWGDAHFYFSHRLLHEVPLLYRHVHKVHHQSINLNPFAGLSFHPLETILYMSSMLSFLVIPQPLWAYHTARVALVLAPVEGHSGYNLSSIASDHWIHHTKFNYNFGSNLLGFSIWDTLMGTAYTEREERGASARALGAAAQAAITKTD